MTTVAIPQQNDDVDPDNTDRWRLVRAGELAPIQGDHGSWVETDHPAVVACMGSVPQCAANGCQFRKVAAWQPIETAPKDGTLIDVWCSSPDGVEQWRLAGCWWDASRKKWVSHHGMFDVATHWMPIIPPVGGADGGRESPA